MRLFESILLLFFFNSCQNCNTKCIAEYCFEKGINYGKYCGIAYTGCPGEVPCDNYDKCCMEEDLCMQDPHQDEDLCKEKFVVCMLQALQRKDPTFTHACSAEEIVKTMTSNETNYDIYREIIKLQYPHEDIMQNIEMGLDPEL